jgi:hypothetical protein
MTDAAALIEEADRHYAARDWARALAGYRRARALDGAAPVGFPMGHCAIELATPDTLEAALETPALTPATRDLQRVTELRLRILELCFAQDFARASRLLRFLAEVDRSIQGAYATLTKGRTACLEVLERAPAPADPPFLAHLLVDEAALPVVKARHAGRRLLLVSQRYFDDPARQHDLTDNIARSAREFGLMVHEVNSHVLRPGTTVDEFPGHLMSEIIAFRPDVIVYDDLFHLGISAATEAVAEAVGAVLEQVRALLGVRVVRTLPDGWNTVLRGDDHLFRGLGTSVDLLHHTHPAIIGRGTSAQQAATLCYAYPTSLEPPTVPIASVPRACFAGTVHYASLARVVWWAEATRAGLPIDFVITLPFETPHLKSAPISDVAFSNLLGGHQLVVNLTQRLGGTCILTGRTMEVMLAGGVLLEENSVDTAHFFQPGVHYLPFESLEDVRVLIERLLPDAPRRRAIAESAQRWARRYITGDQFWAELFARLDRL